MRWADPATSVRRLAIVLGLVALPAPLALAQEPAPVPAALTPASGEDIAAAIESGAHLVRRSIKGADLAAVLTRLLGPQSKCDGARGLTIEKSAIDGDVDLKGSTAESVQEDDGGEETEAPERSRSDWVPIAITIEDSSVAGRLRFSNLGLACKLTLNGSTLGDIFSITATTFAADVSAINATFGNGLQGRGVTWGGAVAFGRAKFQGLFELIPAPQDPSQIRGTADFSNAVFERFTNVPGTKFNGHLDFRYAQFRGGASFNRATITAGSARSSSGPFYLTEFSGPASFRGVQMPHGLLFLRTLLRGGADFRGAHGTALTFRSASLSGQVSFDGAIVDKLEFDAWGSSMILDGDVFFRRAHFKDVVFTGALFKRTADFEGASVKRSFKMQTVYFDDDVSLQDTTFPETRAARRDDAEDGEAPQFVLGDTMFNKGIHADAQRILVPPPWWAAWREAEPRFSSELDKPPKSQSDREEWVRFWRGLERAFESAGNLELKNYAAYRARVLEDADAGEPGRLLGSFSRWFWGYGVRPLRVVVWSAMFLLAFAGLYWTQLDAGADKRPRMARALARGRQALVFSWRTAWEVKYGYEHSATPLFRAIASVQSILGKTLLICFAYALTQTSPLLSELLKKLLP